MTLTITQTDARCKIRKKQYLCKTNREIGWAYDESAKSRIRCPGTPKQFRSRGQTYKQPHSEAALFVPFLRPPVCSCERESANSWNRRCCSSVINPAFMRLRWYFTQLFRLVCLSGKCPYRSTCPRKAL